MYERAGWLADWLAGWLVGLGNIGTLLKISSNNWKFGNPEGTLKIYLKFVQIIANLEIPKENLKSNENLFK